MTLLSLLRSITVVVFALAFSATSSLALEAAAKIHLNVRSGPGGSFGVVDTLFTGEVVQVGECRANGWCYITHSGPDGWVSSNYLRMAASGGSSGDPDCSLSLTIGTGSPSLTITCGSTPVTPTPPVVASRVCFYNNQNFGGTHFCTGPRTMNALNATFNDRISSVQVHGGAKVKLCVNNNLGGFCRQIGTNRAALSAALNNRASSLVVFTGGVPVPPTPVTHSTGTIRLPKTFTANLDNGAVGGGSEVDIWYRVASPTNKMLTPRNGARFSLGSGANRGFAGCSTASFSNAPISTSALPVGTYVCVRTNRNRISQFRVNAYSTTRIRLGYTTWAH